MRSILLFSIYVFISIIWISSNARQDKPKILLILVDDFKPNLGVYEDPVAVSPSIDRL